ncbi:MAG: hypothetical protein DWQ01_00670 [Planctomycetota bacterium]|nr:MAG: hypothetical protein DWQ01_00670 [Planctomycetota bacterium]
MPSTLLAAALAFWPTPPGLNCQGPPSPEYDLEFDTPVTVWDEALPLGNGLFGALVWGDGHPLRISLDRTDLWDLRPVPQFQTEEYSYATMLDWVRTGRLQDLHRLFDDPYGNAGPTKIPAGRIELHLGEQAAFERTSLSLAEGIAEVKFRNGSSARVWIHATRPLGKIVIQGALDVQPALLAPKFGGPVHDPAAPGKISPGDLASLGYPPPEEHSGENWTGYLQQGWNDFRFAVALTWRKSEKDWMAFWSIATSKESSKPLETALNRCRAALKEDDEVLVSDHRGWWQDYWSRSGIRVPDPVLQRQWYLETYKFGAAARQDTPPITLQGPWTADNGKIPPWKGDYHHDLNTELSYWPCYSGNRLEGGLGFLNWLWETRGAARRWTQRFFDRPGLAVPMTTDLNGEQIGGWHQYTHSATTSAWLAHHFYLHWRYSGDREFLQERAWPYLREVAVFLEAISVSKEGDFRSLELSSSPEIHDNRLEAWFPSITNYDLALMRWLFGATAELAEELGENKQAKHWRKVQAELPELALDSEDGRLLVAKGHPLEISHRHFSHLMAIHPLGLIQWEGGEAARRTMLAALEEMERLGTGLWTGYSFAWQACFAARARDGERAAKALTLFATAFCLRNSFHCNGDQSSKGYSRFRYRPFTLEGNFAFAAALQEMLLQSHGGLIRLFPALPSDWEDVSFDRLRAEGAFLISARFAAGTVRRVEIVSEKGGECRIQNPWPNAELSVQGMRLKDMKRTEEELRFPTSPGQEVVLELDPSFGQEDSGDR